MCVAIPMGKRDGESGTRFGRFLRARPSRITTLAALGVLSSGVLVLLTQSSERWPLGALLLANAAALLIFGALLERLPARCRGSETGYQRYGMIGLTALLAALALLTGHPGSILGVLLFAVTWQLADRPLTWQLAWCRKPPPSGLRRLPLLLTAGTLILLVIAVSTLADAWSLATLFSILFGLLVGLMASLVIRNRADLI